MQIPFKLAANLWKLWRVKFLRIEISYDYVVNGGYGTRTKNSYGKLSFPFSWIYIFFKFSLLYHLPFLTGVFHSGIWKMFVKITNNLESGLNLLGQARSFHACWTRMLYRDSLETIENSQRTNSAKALKIFNIYSRLGLQKVMSQFFKDHEIQNPGSQLINWGPEKILKKKKT